jgi:two-component system, OmpR family, heavy metal sensor histidine kinase CusS
MRPREPLRHWLARSDVQTASIISAALALCVIVPGMWLYAHLATESLREVDRWFEFVLDVAVREVDEHGADALAEEDPRGRLPTQGASVRVRAPTGEVLFERGDWPEPEHEIFARSRRPDHRKHGLESAWMLRPENWIVGERATGAGVVVELALPLRHFASESEEVLGDIALMALIAAAAVLPIGFATALRAFAPLRRATARLREVDTGSLGVRLPSRGTGDPIDLHAETLNSVLARIDAGFARLRSFSSDAAHELRTPLNRIHNVSEVALLEGGEKDLRTALEAVHHTAEDLTRTVHALLLLAEIDERRFALQPRAISLAPWIEQHVEAYAPSFEEVGVALAAKSEAIEIEGDRVLLDRIIANLLDNALGHAPSGSRVEIQAARRDGGVAIAVDDAGPGIPEPDRERVFDRFARLSGANTPGHGLGLSLARAIAELHGGTLRASKSPLGGARFELWLAIRESSSAG